MVDEDLDIVLHSPAGSAPPLGQTSWGAPGAIQPSPLEHGRRTRSSTWLWGVLAAAIVVVLIGLAAGMHHSPSPALEHLQQADQEIRDGDFEAAKEECSQAISVDPDCIGAYYRKGLLLLGLGEGESEDRIAELIDCATRGETSDLDAADECFRQCLQKASSSSDENADGTGITKSDMVAHSYLNLALTATLRVVANDVSQHPDYARQWADTARQYISMARGCQLDYRESCLAETMEDLLSESGY